MHDIRAIRDNPEIYDRGWALRGMSGQTKKILQLDLKLRAAQTAAQEAQTRRNEVSKSIANAKARHDEADVQRLMTEVEALKRVITKQEKAQANCSKNLKGLLSTLANIPAPEVPHGADEHGNIEIRRDGTPRTILAPKDHVALGENLGLMDFEAAARTSGARFVFLKGDLARLERALGAFMLDIQTREHDYVEISPPLLVRDEAVFGTGQLPKFKNDLFSTIVKDVDLKNPENMIHIIQAGMRFIQPKLTEYMSKHSHLTGRERGKLLVPWVKRNLKNIVGDRMPEFSAAIASAQAKQTPHERTLWLIPTAEVSLTNMVLGQILDAPELPMRLTALTPSFRSEAGASGKDTRGMIRQHQFYKVELVSITTPDQSNDEHERMTGCAEAVLQRLELPFRTMLLCTGDMGFSARKTYDLEVWMPSQGVYREISSCSNCGDFQARRMDARFRIPGVKGAQYLHTLNGSGLAVGRTLVAVLENYQDEGGRIAIPQALQPYMNGQTHIEGKA